MVLQTDRFTDLEVLHGAYVVQSEAEGKSASTLRIYGTALRSLCRFLEREGLPTDVTRIGPDEIRSFMAHLQTTKAFVDHPLTGPQEKGLAGHTVNCYLRAVRAFWGWLIAEEIIDVNPFDKVKVPRAPKKLIQPFDWEQVRSLLGAVDPGTPEGFRDQALMMTFLDTGMRASELTDLRLEDANVPQRYLKVRGKGGRERFVPIGALVQKNLIRYIGQYRPSPCHPFVDNVFLTRSGAPLTVNRVEAIVEKYAAKAGLTGVRASPHTFRHTFAIFYLRNGGDVFTLQRILGHETLDMVRNYVNLARHDIQEAHLRYSPADRMLGPRREPTKYLLGRKV
jgi:site-specific recombinase XerD